MNPGNKGNADKKKSKTGLIIMAVILVLLGAATLIIVLNLFNFREGVLMPYLRGAPIIGSFFSQPDEDEDELYGLTITELRRRYYMQRAEAAAMQRAADYFQNRLAVAEDDIRWLQWFQGRWEQYIYVRARLDQILAHAAPEDFIEWFETMHPENLDALYLEIQSVVEYNTEMADIVRMLNQMEAELAGEALESLMMRDTALMLNVFRRMSATRQAEILDTLEYTTVTLIIQIMADPPPVVAQFEPPPQLQTPPHPSLTEPPPPPAIVIPEAPDEEDEEETEYDDIEEDEEGETEDEEAEED